MKEIATTMTHAAIRALLGLSPELAEELAMSVVFVSA